ncbi:hypothetical protein UFOVP276_88 [uncultured Caudovirales phage]|uniref:Uncharacterized protein n=1 Tax=uncultured Caudovirales phage TaxID=2100421 RepID=A0A6J5LNC8_9CAUD|nr:hypothetical protein UFOVP127_225 [uncultured Caudovirales phage]CAB4135132.1 hypothetical protein UFOVP276_88 [uncultured Caudovirales phage]
MRISNAESKINALQVTEATITNFPETGVVLNATYALAQYDERTGKIIHTHGKCTATPKNWSEETLIILKELLEAMELDLIPRHFTVQQNSKMEKSNERIETRGHEEADQV